MFEVISACQRFICALSPEDSSREPSARRFLESLPRPVSPGQEFLLRATLSRLAVSCALRRRASPQARSHRALLAAVRILVDRGQPLDRAFLAWARAAHRRRPARAPLARLARRLRRPAVAPSTLRALARELGSSERALRAAFQRAYGLSPGEFRQRYQVITALALLRDGTLKIEAVAREVGFRSPKNLYHLLRQATGLTPQQIQRLDRRAYAELRRRLRPPAKRRTSE